MGDGVAEPSIMACHHGHLNGWIMSNGASLPDVAICQKVGKEFALVNPLLW